MTRVNITDAEKNLMALLQLLASGQQDEIILTQEGLPNFKITVEDDAITKKRKSMFGIAKDKWNLPPDFDEKFVAMDAEILADFSDDPDCEF